MGVRFVYANIKNNPDMPPDQVRSDIRKVGDLGGLIGWQELQEEADRDALRSELKKGWQHVFDDCAIPISFKTAKWKLLSKEKVKTCDGKEKVSPNRFLTAAKLQRTDNTAKKIVFINTHYVSGAWSSPPKDPVEWRRNCWNNHWDKEKKMVKKYVDAGFTVIGCGDFNRKDMKKFLDSQKWIDNGGIDKSFWVPGGNIKVDVKKWNDVSDSEKKFYTDHHPTWVEFVLDIV